MKDIERNLLLKGGGDSLESESAKIEDKNKKIELIEKINEQEGKNGKETTEVLGFNKKNFFNLDKEKGDELTMPVQETIIIIKPDGLEKGLVGQILCNIQALGLSVIDHARTHLNSAWVEKLYEGEEKEVYFKEVVNWVSSAPVFFLKVRGVEAVKKVKWNIIGRYPKGIRGQYSKNWIENVAHAPDSNKSAKREINLSKEIFEERRKKDERLFKGKMVFVLTGMSECGKSTVGKYFDSCGIPRLKIVKFFERIRDKWSPNEELYQFIRKEEKKDPCALWDAVIDELLVEMDTQNASKISIESLYGGGFGPYLKQRMDKHFCIIYLDVPVKIRLERQMQREKLTTIKEAKEILFPRDKIKAKSGIPALKDIADKVIDNSGTIEDLYQIIDQIIAHSE